MMASGGFSRRDLFDGAGSSDPGVGRPSRGSGTALLERPRADETTTTTDGPDGSAEADPPPSPQAAAAPHAPARPQQATIGSAEGDLVHVMTCNIRLARAGTEPGDPDHWGDREPVLARFLELEQPTVLGVQEALSRQLPAIARALPHHRMLGYGRDGGSGGEYSAIFYDERRLDVVAWDQFWLSDLPELIGSRSWGCTTTRIATWARFRDRRSGAEFVHLNTHLDHESELARVKSADLITERLQEVASGAPVVVTGDFNAPAEESAAYDILTRDAGLADTWTTAAHHATPDIGTFTAYGDPVPEGERIDWILAGSGVEVVDSAINPYTYEGRSPSDHAAVQALVRLARTA